MPKNCPLPLAHWSQVNVYLLKTIFIDHEECTDKQIIVMSVNWDGENSPCFMNFLFINVWIVTFPA